jgi:hypothetical protein
LYTNLKVEKFNQSNSVFFWFLYVVSSNQNSFTVIQSSKMIDLESTAGEMNVVQYSTHRHRRFRCGPDRVFAADTDKEELGGIEFFFHPSRHIWPGPRRLFTSVEAKKGIARYYNGS